jgi:hypothetical protein
MLDVPSLELESHGGLGARGEVGKGMAQTLDFFVDDRGFVKVI